MHNYSDCIVASILAIYNLHHVYICMLFLQSLWCESQWDSVNCQSVWFYSVHTKGLQCTEYISHYTCSYRFFRRCPILHTAHS